MIILKYIKLAAATESVNYFACSLLHQTQHDGHKTKMGYFCHALGRVLKQLEGGLEEAISLEV